MMTPKQMKELFGTTKSVPAGTKNTAKQIQKKFSSPLQQMLNKRKNIYPPHPAEQNAKHVVADKVQ